MRTIMISILFLFSLEELMSQSSHGIELRYSSGMPGGETTGLPEDPDQWDTVRDMIKRDIVYSYRSTASNKYIGGLQMGFSHSANEYRISNLPGVFNKFELDVDNFSFLLASTLEYQLGKAKEGHLLNPFIGFGTYIYGNSDVRFLADSGSTSPFLIEDNNQTFVERGTLAPFYMIGCRFQSPIRNNLQLELSVDYNNQLMTFYNREFVGKSGIGVEFGLRYYVQGPNKTETEK